MKLREPMEVRLRLHIEDIFTPDEIALIWGALDKYDVGPKDVAPKLWVQLERRRKKLLELFS